MEDTIDRAVTADEQRQSEFDNIKQEVSIVQRAIDTPGTIAKAADIASKRMLQSQVSVEFGRVGGGVLHLHASHFGLVLAAGEAP